MIDLSSIQKMQMAALYGEDALNFLDEFNVADRNLDLVGDSSRTPCCVVVLSKEDALRLLERLKMLFPDMCVRSAADESDMWYVTPDSAATTSDWILNFERPDTTYDHLFYLKKFGVTPE